MSKTYVAYRGKGEWMQDSAIEVALYLVLEVLPEKSSLAALRQSWSELIRMGWSGFVDPKLDRWLTDESRADVCNALAVVGANGRVVSAEELTREQIGGRGVQWSVDLGPSSYIADVKCLLRIISD